MKKYLSEHSGAFAAALFAVWIFIVWRICGMPSPGFAGRIIPGAWMLAAMLSGSLPVKKWFFPMAVSFTAASWLWMTFEPAWYFAGAIPVAGLIAWGITTAGEGRYGVFKGILPVLLLAVITSEVNSDEVRFGEISASVTGISSEKYGQMHFRPGDISPGEGHHTLIFPVLIAPGLMAGDLGIRIVPVLICILAVAILARAAGPVPAVAGALLYPGFSTLGLAMTGWLAAGLFTLTLFWHRKKWGQVARLAAAVFLVALKMRYAGLALGMILAEYICLKPARGKWLIPAGVIIAGILILAADRYLMGGEIFWVRYGNIESLKLIWINIFHRPFLTLANAGWSLLDIEGGLFFRAPWVVASIFGLSAIRERSPQLFIRLVVPSVLYWVVLIIWSGTSWHGLPAPAGRVFLPMVPMFVFGLGEVWKRDQTKILLALSAAVSALVLVYPAARSNYADGTDSILSLIGSHSAFSMVRSSPVILYIGFVPIVCYFLIMGRKTQTAGFAVLILAAASFLSGIESNIPEAEDLTGENMQGVLLYPRLPDPALRYFWFGSRERMVEISEAGQSILFTGVDTGDTLVMEASSSGGILKVGSCDVTVQTPLMAMPEELALIGRREAGLPDLPENRIVQLFRVPLCTDDGTLRIVFSAGDPVYIDRIGIE